VACAEPEDEKETVVVRPPELETGVEGEGDEEGAEGEQKPEGVWQVAPQLATPAKLPPAVLDPVVKTTRGRSPGDTPSRDEVLRQNAADRMEDELDAALKWAVVVAVPKAVRELSVAEESEREETRMARRGPLFEDQNFHIVPVH
jgi:hypothetical protein